MPHPESIQITIEHLQEHGMSPMAGSVMELRDDLTAANILIADILDWGREGRESYERWWPADQQKYKVLLERADALRGKVTG